MKWRSICSVTSKSAMTPSFNGRIAEIVPGVRPSMRFASTPTACTSPVRESIATTEGSDRTMPRPRTYTSVFAVPRSTAMSRPPKPVRVLKKAIAGTGSLSTGLQQLWREFFEESHEERGREPDDVQIVALDCHDEAPAESLDRVRTRASLPLAALQVGLERIGSEPAKRHVGRIGPGPWFRCSQEAQARYDRVCPLGELGQHPC